MKIRLAPVFAVASMVAVLACGDSRAAKLQGQASAFARAGKYPEAIETLEDLKRHYGDSPAAREVDKQITVYRGLLEADLKEKRRQANEDLILIGRELQKRQDSAGRYTGSLGALGGALRIIDPWGRPYRYQTLDGGRRYRLGCLGADGAAGGAGDDQDLLVENGTFKKDLAWEDQ